MSYSPTQRARPYTAVAAVPGFWLEENYITMKTKLHPHPPWAEAKKNHRSRLDLSLHKKSRFPPFLYCMIPVPHKLQGEEVQRQACSAGGGKNHPTSTLLQKNSLSSLQ